MAIETPNSMARYYGNPILTVYILQYRIFFFVLKAALQAPLYPILNDVGVFYNFGVTFHRLNNDAESGVPLDFFQGTFFS